VPVGFQRGPSKMEPSVRWSARPALSATSLAGL
jgi:hypothetical protein